MAETNLAAVIRAKFPEIASHRRAFHAAPQVRMTGSGSGVFAACSTEREARDALALLPAHIHGRRARDPLAEFAR